MTGSDVGANLFACDDERPPLGLVQKMGRAIAALIVLATFGVWVYAFSGFADRPTPDVFDNPTFANSAEPICAAARIDIGAVPGALEATSGADRGRQVEATTLRIEQMLDELDSIVTGSERDVQIQSEWLSNWRTLVGDRYRYANDVATDPAALFVVTDLGISESLERRLTRLATVNEMPSCGAPGDVG
ncbi:MAG: hypothetical protein GY939_28100 [Actinomycetia bacterium]|nr:hypothetical protein [Actinomycetes bacterium]